MKFIAVLILGAASLAFAQKPVHETTQPDPPPAKGVENAPPKPPVFTAEFRAELFKAEADATGAQLVLERAQADLPKKLQVFQTKAQEGAAFCGDKFNFQLDTDGQPLCVLKPTPEPKK